MSEQKFRYLRMVIDVTVFEDAEEFGEKLAKEGSGPTNNEHLGRELFDNIQAGVVEIDAVADVRVF